MDKVFSEAQKKMDRRVIIDCSKRISDTMLSQICDTITQSQLTMIIEKISEIENIINE